jgi:glycine/D-amino acid oxidase-like deaminating enzyme
MIRAMQTVVVIGSGALGSSTAYHLARRGADVTLVDQYALGSQTSPRAAGLTNTIATSTDIMARLMLEATEALADFERKMGRSIDFHRSGSLKAAYTEAGEARLRSDLERAARLGATAELVSAAEAERLAPWFKPGDARAIGYVPTDSYLEPSKLPIGFAQRAAELGARTLPFTRVSDLLRDDGRVVGVAGGRGEIRADAVVDAAGAWTPLVAARAGIRVPLVPVRHQLYVTEPIPGVEPLQPIVRLLEASVYVRHERGGLLFGGYEDTPRALDPAELKPGFQIADLELDLGVLRSLVDEVAEHFPILREAPVALHRGGLPTMTPDNLPILGGMPGLDGFYVASGCCVGGLSLSPAAGRALADLVLDGTSDPDLSPLSVERFRGRYGDPADLEAACLDAYARKYMK